MAWKRADGSPAVGKVRVFSFDPLEVVDAEGETVTGGTFETGTGGSNLFPPGGAPTSDPAQSSPAVLQALVRIEGKLNKIGAAFGVSL